MPHPPSNQAGPGHDYELATLVGNEEQPHIRSMVEQYDHDVVDVDDLPFGPAESPLSKRLDLEQGQGTQQTDGKVRSEGNITPAFLTRPASHGNDVKVPQFAPRPPFRNIKGCVVGDVPKITFAPQRRRAPVSEGGIFATERPRSHSPTARSEPPLSSSPPARRASSLPDSGQLVQSGQHGADPITIPSDQEDSRFHDNDIPVEIVSRAGSRDSSATKECERSASGDAMMHGESSPQSQAHATLVTSVTQQAPKLVPDQDIQDVRQKDNASNIEDSPEEQTCSVATRTPTRSRTPSVLMTPARVSKASISQPGQRLSTKPSRAGPVPAPPSEEDLLLVLMHRSRKRGEAVDRLKAKIKTLEHRNFELHVETTSSRQERDDTLAVHTELKQRHTLLQTKLDEFTARYYKLKAFARLTHQDFMTLRRDAEKQNASIRDLSQVGEQMQASLQDVRTGIQTAQSSLATHIRGLTFVRSETQKLVSSATQLSADLGSKTDRVMELQRDKGRLEGHILYLEHAKQRASQASTDSSRDITSALTKLASRVDEIDCSTLVPPQIAVEQCLALVRALHKKKEVSTEEFEKLSKTVTALETTVADGIETINASFQRTQNSNARSSHVQVVQELKECLKEMQLSAVHIGQSHIDRARLEERLKASAAMMEQLRKSMALAESHAATFRKGMDSSIGMSNLQQERLTQVQTQNQEYQIRWNTATSNLASMKRDLMNKEEEAGGEIAILSTLVHDEEYKRRVSEDNAILLQQEHERVLEERTRELLCELECKTAALKQSEAKVAISEQNEAAHALLLHQLETLQQSYDALQATEKKTRSDGHHLQHEHTRVQRQLETALQELAEADKVKPNLRDLRTLYEAAKKEAEEVVSTRSELHALRQQFDILQQEGKTKTAEVNTLQRKLGETARYPAIIEELGTKISTVSAQGEDLRNKLDEASTRAAEVDDLRAELSSRNATIEKLKADLTTGRQSQHQLRVLVEEKDRLTQDLTGARRELEIAQQRLQTKADLENVLQQKEEEVTRLQRIAARMENLSQDFDAQKGESQQKDSQIASLRAKLDRVKVESKEAEARGQGSIGGVRPDELEELLTQHSDISYLQAHQTQRDAQLSDGAMLNQRENSNVARPDRRIAHRSTLQQRIEQPGVQVRPFLNGTPPVSTNGTDVVQNSQLDVHIRDALGIVGPYHTGMRAPSPLSSVHSDIEDALSDHDEGNHSSPPEIPETLQDGLLRFKPPQLSQSQLEPLPDQERNTVRPSSSAMSEDLFKQHANHLTVTTDPRKRTILTNRNQDNSQLVRGHGHPQSDFYDTMAPQTLQYHTLVPVSSHYISPKHLRSGAQFGDHQSTPAPNLGPDGHNPNQITPTLQRDKNQPNSAMKRKSDGEMPRPKRLERNYQNLDVRPPPRSSFQGAVSSSQRKTITPSHRQGGSVVGTPAPVPGKSQKTNKQTRTNSKRDKYGERFAQKP